MAHTNRITRENPGCIVVLIDRSWSMHERWYGSSMSLAQGAAQAVNNMLWQLGIRATIHSDEVDHYLDVAVFGYGCCLDGSGEGVESALGGALAGKALVPLPELADNPLRWDNQPSLQKDLPDSTVPIWVEALHGYGTPMCRAMSVAGEHVYDWQSRHPGSFPPIIINITDGVVTDAPFQGAGLAEWAQRLTTLGTHDGSAILLNVFLSPVRAEPVWFPPLGTPLPDPGPQLLEISSPLPDAMIKNARAANIGVPDGARALVFNADLDALVKFLDIGTNIEDA